MDEQKNEQWAVVELMGHARTAGRISRPSDWGGLLRVDVPEKEGYRTEYYGMPAIYAVRLVSEEIARAYAGQVVDAPMSFDVPIVTRDQYNAGMDQARRQLTRAQERINELERRLTAVNALPEPENRNPWYEWKKEHVGNPEDDEEGERE